MKYFTLYPADPSLDEWLFFADDADGRLVLRGEYRDLACSRCGKFDEDVALARGVSPTFNVRTKRDWVATADDRICVSTRLRDVMEDVGIGGAKFSPIPGDGERFVMTCSALVETDEQAACFESHQRCTLCGRYRERLVGPRLAALRVPDVPLSLFASAIANENVKVSYRPIFGSEAAVILLKAAKLRGIDYVAAW